MSGKIEGFSKLSKEEKIDWITKMHFEDAALAKARLSPYNHSDGNLQKRHDEFIENAIANYYLPLGVAPNFVINGKSHTLPMAIEESSVVAKTPISNGDEKPSMKEGLLNVTSSLSRPP
ncbi:MAG: hypothetical protein EBS74_09740 [Flavobacteriia bacterium]|nr:hypothetical protein [Flavobacteriia bacterium]